MSKVKDKIVEYLQTGKVLTSDVAHQHLGIENRRAFTNVINELVGKGVEIERSNIDVAGVQVVGYRIDPLAIKENIKDQEANVDYATGRKALIPFAEKEANDKIAAGSERGFTFEFFEAMDRMAFEKFGVRQSYMGAA